MGALWYGAAQVNSADGALQLLHTASALCPTVDPQLEGGLRLACGVLTMSATIASIFKYLRKLGWTLAQEERTSAVSSSTTKSYMFAQMTNNRRKKEKQARSLA